MLNRIIELSVQNKLIIGLLTFGLICYGIYQVRHLPIDAVPDITDNQVQIITTCPSLGAPDVERQVTFPIEQALGNIPNLTKIRSISRFGLSVVTIVFTDETDLYWARQQVSERLAEARERIPAYLGVPKLAPVSSGLGEIYQYVLRPAKGYEKTYNAMELRTIQDWIVRRQLLGVKGVAEVNSFGGYLKQYEIAIEPGRLKSYNLSIEDVFKALEANNTNTGGAYIEKGPTALFIRSEGLATSIEDIGNIPVSKTAKGSPVLIRDVANIGFGSAPRYGAMTYNGDEEVAGAVVMMLKGGNSNQVIKDIKERVLVINKTLPKGVILDPFLDRTKMVNSSIGTVETNLMEGALIVIFVLIMFLGNLRAGLVVASVIPLSMLVAVILMNLFGVSGNLMSLGTLIIVESCMFRLHQTQSFKKYTQLQMDEIVIETSKRMRNTAVFGELIILVVYLPIFTLTGIEGKMFRPMAQTVAFALFGAFLMSLTYVPMISALLLSRKIPEKQTLADRMMHKLENIYERMLAIVLRFPKTPLIAAFGLFLIAGFVLSRLGGEFIPALEEGDFAIETRLLTGSNLNASVEAVSRASKILIAKFPEVEQVVGKTGSSEIPTDPMPLEASDLMVILKHSPKWLIKWEKNLKRCPGYLSASSSRCKCVLMSS